MAIPAHRARMAGAPHFGLPANAFIIHPMKGSASLAFVAFILPPDFPV
jgi:hypothetical protein